MPLENQPTRKLAAIFFADIVGYTAMMQADEGLAISRLQRYKDVLNEEVNAYGGEIIKSYGDGSLCVFSSVLSATNCARAVQEGLRSGDPVPLRIGIHLGDIMYRENDIYGDALNIASRIESMGIGGSVLVSRDVYKKVKNQADLSFKSLGRFELKNVVEPLEIYALNTPGVAVPEPGEISGKAKSLSPDVRKGNVIKWGTVGLAAILVFALFQSNLIQSLFGTKGDVEFERGAVAVMNFENNTQDLKFDLLGKMVSNRIIHGITENDIARVITNETIDDYNRVSRASLSPESQNSFLSSRFGVKEIVKGNIYQLGDSLLFDCVLSNAETEEVIKGIKTIKCSANEPMKGIEELKQTVLGFLALSKDMQLNLSLETSPPKYEAYKELLLAKEKGNADKDEEELMHLNRAIEIDSTYFEPQVLRLSQYYNMGSYALVDSLLDRIDIGDKKTDKRQKNLLNFYDALLQGKNDLAFNYLNNEYELAPFHIATNMTNMVLAVQFINRLDLAEDIYKAIPSDGMDIANCSNCQSRIFVKIYMDIEQGRLNKAIDLANLLIKSGDFGEGLLTRALVKTGQWSALDEFIEQYRNEDSNADLLPHYFAAAKECVSEGNSEKASEYLVKAESSFTAESNKGRVGDIHFMKDDFGTAKSIFEEILNEDPNSLKALSYLGGLYLKNNETEKSDKMIKRINDQRTPYQYGDIDYWLARGYAIGGNEDQAIAKLKACVSQGYRYGFQDFQNDFIFASIKDKPTFKEILTYWH